MLGLALSGEIEAMTLYEQLTRDEGKRARMYLDSEGVPTIGIGHNLRDRPISERAIQIIFEDDLADTEADVRMRIPVFATLSEARRGVLLNMAFNLGIGGLLEFRKMLEALRIQDWDRAATEMLDSKWASQVGARATRLAEQMITGEWT